MADLLAYGRPTASEFSTGSIDVIVARAVESCGTLARETGATIEVRLDPNPPPVRLDPGRLGQALHNLVDNALRHAPQGSIVTIETRRIEHRGGSWIECAVSDRGPGFSAADLPHVFEPFFTRRRGGTGLGLALVQRIVSEHGGEVLAGNHEEGGAVVTIRLPVAQA
jgi:signal transduction histidine kinase